MDTTLTREALAKAREALIIAFTYVPGAPTNLEKETVDLINRALATAVQPRPVGHVGSHGELVASSSYRGPALTPGAPLYASPIGDWGLEAAALACERVAAEFGGVAEGPLATERGKLVHEAMAAGALNCSAAVRALASPPPAPAPGLPLTSLFGVKLSPAPPSLWPEGRSLGDEDEDDDGEPITPAALGLQPRALPQSELDTPVAWVYFFNDPDPQSEIEFCRECPTGWVGKAEPLYEKPTIRNIELQRRAALAEGRLSWLHSQAACNVDGYEWGIFRVKWVNGQPAEVWQTNGDFSDLDAAIGIGLPGAAEGSSHG